MTKWIVEWSERKKAIVNAKTEEEAEQKAYNMPDIEVHQETIGLSIKKLKEVVFRGRLEQVM